MVDAMHAPESNGLPEGARRLSEVVECDEPLRRLVDALLGRIVLVNDIGAARRVQQIAPGHYTAVTPQGDVLAASGALTTGAPGKAAGLIGRMTEMTQLNGRLSELVGRAERLEAAVKNLEQQAIEVDMRRRDAVAKHAELGKEHHQVERDLSRIDETLRALAEERTVIGRERETLSDDIEASLSQEAELKETLADLSSKQDEANQRISERSGEVDRLAAEAREASEKLNAARIEQARRREELTSAEDRVRGLEGTARDLENQLNAVTAQIEDNTRRQNESRNRLDEVQPELGRLQEDAAAASKEIERLDAQRREKRHELTGVTEKTHVERVALQKLEGELQDSRMQENESRFQMETIAGRIEEDYNQDIAHIHAEVIRFEKAAEEAGVPRPHELPEAEQEAAMARMDELAAEVDEAIRPYLNWREDVGNPDELNKEVEDLRERIRKLGNVNLDSIADEQALQERHEFLVEQQRDLEQAKTKLEEVIERINVYSRNRFLEVFTDIRENFQETFRKLFGGGRADVVLENEEEPLDSGIEITARPPGKENRSITLLSGGEKTMTTVALLFAIFKAKPSPFCVLDEVDAALDEANIDRFVAMLQEFLDESQFLIVTHSKRTMSAAGTIYGVTMQQSGVSKKIAVSFESSTQELVAESEAEAEAAEEIADVVADGDREMAMVEG